MQQTKTKYNSDTIGVVCSNEELQVIDEYNKQLQSLPIYIQEDLALGISHIVEKYGFSYLDVFDKSKIQVGQMVIDKEKSIKPYTL